MANHIATVALDGSATAEAVLPWAGELARGLGLRLVLVHIHEAARGASVTEQVRAAETYLDRTAETLRSSGVEVQQRVVVVEESGGATAAGIVEQARAMNAAWIMLATHGRSGPRRWALGSVADEVIRAAPCPVLVVRVDVPAPKDRPRRIGRILTPLDGSATAEAALTEALRIARAFAAILDLIQVVPWAAAVYGAAPEVWQPEDLDDRLARAADDYLGSVQDRLPSDLPCERQVLRGAPAAAILDHAERTGADLIVMGTHGRSGLGRFLLGSVADQVVRAASVPVLLVRGAASSSARQ